MNKNFNVNDLVWITGLPINFQTLPVAVVGGSNVFYAPSRNGEGYRSIATPSIRLNPFRAHRIGSLPFNTPLSDHIDTAREMYYGMDRSANWEDVLTEQGYTFKNVKNGGSLVFTPYTATDGSVITMYVNLDKQEINDQGETLANLWIRGISDENLVMLSQELADLGIKKSPRFNTLTAIATNYLRSGHIVAVDPLQYVVPCFAEALKVFEAHASTILMNQEEYK